MSGAARPPRNPLACGALGRYDAEIVGDLRRHLGIPMSVAHDDEQSVLLLDRPAIEWRTRRARGFAWSEDPFAAGDATSWKDAASELSACGLVLKGERRRVHSSVSGVAPVYFVEHDGAVYFASRIDPLVRAVPARFGVDWRTWAAIFYLRFPLGERTPFREVKRLRPFSTLEWDREHSRANARQHRWPWAEVDPSLDLSEGSEPLVEAMRTAVAPLAEAPVVCTLSGGRDSRLLLCLLAQQDGQGVRAVTVSRDNNAHREIPMAAEVAARLDVPHAALATDDDSFWSETRERALRVDYQLPAPPWAMPLATGLAGHDAVTDGLGLDALAQAGTRFYTEPMTRPDGTAATTVALWRRLLGSSMRRAVRRTLSAELDHLLRPVARRQFMREGARYRGHPAEAVLTHYTTRTLRGISLTPEAILGAEMATVTPFIRHSVALACLAIRPPEKFHNRIYEALFAAVNPSVGELPSTHEDRRGHARMDLRRSLSRTAVKGYSRVLADGPLTPLLSPELCDHLARGTLAEGLEDSALRRGVLAVSLFHLWHDRYRDRLSAGDPLSELELAPARRATGHEGALAQA